MNNENNNSRISLKKCLFGVCIGVAVFMLLQVVCALLIDKEALSIDNIPLFSYSILFISVFAASFFGTGNTKVLGSSLICVAFFIISLIVIGCALYRAPFVGRSVVTAGLITLAAIFLAVLLKGAMGVKYVRKKY